MATATRARRQITRQLLEYRALEFMPDPAGKQRVDRDAGIIRGVKVAGGSSPNKHQVEGVSGTDYEPSALREALSLYEGARVNCDHPERDPITGKPLKKDRPAESRLGKLVNARMDGGCVYADLHCLKSHPMWERIAEAAERDDMSDCFALSHNAYGKGEVRNGRYVITHIPEVRSVDLVADGGTNRSLFESREPMKTLRNIVESALAAGKLKRTKRLKALLEDDAMAPMMDAEAPGGGEEMDHMDHIYAAFKKLKDEDPEQAKKLLAMLKSCCGDEEVEESDEEDEEPSSREDTEDDDSGGNKDEKKKDAKKKDAMESRLQELERKDACRTLCESADFLPTPLQLEALMGLATEAKRKAMVAELKAARGKSGPKSRSLHQEPAARQTQESAVPKDAEGQLSWLMG